MDIEILKLILELIFGLIIGIGIIFLLGFIMLWFIRPLHDKIWKQKIERKRNAHSIFVEGIWLKVLLIWFPFILILALGSLWLAITSLLEGSIFGFILGLILATFFGAKIYYMFEHREVAKKKSRAKAKKKAEKKAKQK